MFMPIPTLNVVVETLKKEMLSRNGSEELDFSGLEKLLGGG
jgi:hypothetical protein